MLSASNLRQQRRLWQALGRSDLVKENNRERIRGYAAESAALKQIIATQPLDHWERTLQAVRVPVSRIQRMEAMLADEHVKCRGVLHRFDETAGPLEGLTVPVAGFRLSSCDVGVSALAQTAGAQNQEILSGLGYSNAEIESLKVNGVI